MKTGDCTLTHNGLDNYLGITIDCDCGRVHKTEIKRVEISGGALDRVADLLRQDNFRNPFIIADCNTHGVVGEDNGRACC